MTDNEQSTIAELAEVIADQNERIRELHRQLDEQNDVICGYELDQGDTEKVDAALCQDLRDFAADHCLVELDAIIDNYFDEDEG